MKKNFAFETSKETFYHKYTELINILYQLRLTKKQIGMLSELIYQNNRYKDRNKDEKATLIFTTENRKDMIKKLNIDIGTFNNNLSIFRTREGTKGTIIIDRNINDNYMVYPDTTEWNNLIISFKI